MRRAKSKVDKWHRWLVGLAAVCFLATGWYWASVRGVPATHNETTVDAWIRHEVLANYTIDLRRGTLYPAGLEVQSDRETIPMNLLANASMTITDQISWAGGDLVAGEYSVYCRVRAGELWHKDYTIIGASQMPVEEPAIDASFSIPFSRIIQDIELIEEEIGLGSPTGQYEVDVRLPIKLTVNTPEEVVYDYVPAFTFVLANRGLVLELPQELLASDEYSEETRVERPNTRYFLGSLREVADVKRTASTGFGLTGMLLIGALGWSYSLRRTVPKDPARRYRDRLIKVATIKAANAELAVRVTGLKELARIADDAQTTIMELDSTSGAIPAGFDGEATADLRGRKFFVVVGSTLYYVV